MQKRRTAPHHPTAAGRDRRTPANALRLPIGPLALIVCAGTLTYWNSLDTPFIWDDRTTVIDNQTIRSVWPLWGPLVPPLETPVSRRPLVNLTLAFNYAAHGLDVTGYHVVNLGVHLLAACLLFSIVRRALSADPLRAQFGARASTIALAATLWWTVHPLLSEIVNYTTQRTTAMAGLLVFATVYAAQRSLETRHRVRWTAAAAIACALGILAKEVVAVAPLIVVLYDRLFAFASFRAALAARASLYAALAISWVELGLLLVLRPHSTVGFSAGIDAWTYALNQARMIPRYVQLAVWPDALVLDYGLPARLTLADVSGLALLVGAAIAATIAALIRWPRAGFLGAAFFLMLAPTSSVLPIATEVGAERRMYLPLAAIAVLGVLGAAVLVERARLRAPVRAQRFVLMASLLVGAGWLTVLSVRTVYRNQEFATRESIWRSSVERQPHGRARLSYASALLDAGKDASALRELRLAVRDYPDAGFALGNQLAAARRYDEAIRELSAFIAAEPALPDRIPARTLRGDILAAQGHLDEAVAEFRTLVALFPANLAPRERLADLLLLRGDHRAAAAQYRVLVGRRPRHAVWLARLGTALDAGGRAAEARDAYRRALDADPRSSAAQLGLASLLLEAGAVREAAAHVEAALEQNPHDAAAHNLLGIARAMEGRVADATTHFERAVDADPGFDEARVNLARARNQLRTEPSRERDGAPGR